MKTVRIAEKHLSALVELGETFDRTTSLENEALRAARSALAPKRVKPERKATLAAKAERKAEERAATSRVYEAVSKRAGLKCECGCGRWFRGFGGAKQMDHFEGRARSESVETCWMLRADCHAEKGANAPSAIHWLKQFIWHCNRHGYAEAAENAQRRLDSERLSAQSEAAGKGVGR